ncbi:MAG: hypothetical protein IPJ62_11075 [Betaproteobacteria bacterium]|nr:hypothetical protein [Betaproteobacteria bacterium]
MVELLISDGADSGNRAHELRRTGHMSQSTVDFTERTVIDGKPATVCYLDAARLPITPEKGR